MNDGSTSLVAGASEVKGLAAMEPAGEQREQEHVIQVFRQPRLAAMEPAGEQREHGMHKVMAGVTDDVPQWSPPLNGGSRAIMHDLEVQRNPPQWSRRWTAGADV